MTGVRPGGAFLGTPISTYRAIRVPGKVGA
jgi:hypothetical protein